MVIHNWQLNNPIDAVIFDCDATLSQIEGIDILAQVNGVAQAVQSLTTVAMEETGINQTIYHQRLQLVQPTATQLAELSDRYHTHMTPDVDRVIQVLQSLGKSIYVISAGIQIAVEQYAVLLGIPREHVFAVDIYFDHNGHYVDYDRASPMTGQSGKREIIRGLKQKHPRVLHIGDGMNDVEAATAVDRFIGYGGAYFRKNIAAMCDFYVTSQSIAPLLPLALTLQESDSLRAAGAKVYEQGMYHIRNGAVLIKS